MQEKRKNCPQHKMIVVWYNIISQFICPKSYLYKIYQGLATTP